LTWTNSLDVALVELYRNGTIIGNVTGPVSQYVDRSLASNTSYEYSLLPSDVNGTEGTMVSITLRTSSLSSSNSGGGSSGGTTSKKSSSSGGGGGGAGSVEDFANVAMKDVSNAYLGMDTNVTYEFTRESNDIQSISFYSLKNSGEITSTIEVLNNRSKLVDSDPEGLVYEYLNISNIKDIRIKFRVDNSWIQEMGVDPADVRLQRYNGAVWEVLPTTLESGTTDYLTFESTTPGFSPFAITAEKVLASPVSSDADLEHAQIENAGTKESQPEKSNIWTIVMAILAISLLAVGYTYLKKRQN
jgi:PGF-pre-PGF domain-containing protein